MKKFALMQIMVVLLAAILFVPNLYAGINDGLVAYYPFNGNTECGGVIC
jgi:hypothetical protein